MNKNIIYVLVGVLIIGGVFFFIKKPEAVVAPTEQNTEVQSGNTPANETPVTVDTTPTTPKAGEYTMVEVTSHNSKSDCWSTVNGDVYNLTAWIGSHPGGAGAILSLCGKDGTAAFNGQHGGGKQEVAKLATFKIGVLVN